MTTILKDNRIEHLHGARVAQGDLWLPVGYRQESSTPVGEYLVAAPWSRP